MIQEQELLLGEGKLGSYPKIIDEIIINKTFIS